MADAVGMRWMVLVACFAVVGVVPTTSTPEWDDLTVDALERFDQLATDAETPHALAAAWHAEGVVSGWHSAAADARRVALDRRVAEVGYGLGVPFDAFSDGTINPPETIYTVTIAEHIGTPMLAGYRAGAVDRTDVQELVDMVAAFPIKDGCVPYSLSRNDLTVGCVNNVNALVGAFLVGAGEAGLDVPGSMAASITERVISSHVGKGWHYIGHSGRMDDPAHAGAQAVAAAALDRRLGVREARRVWNATGDLFARLEVASVLCPIEDDDLRRLAVSRMEVDDPRLIAQIAAGAAKMTACRPG